MSVGLLLVVVFVTTAAFLGSSTEDSDLNNIVGSRLSGDVRSSPFTGNDTFNECNLLREPVNYCLADLVRILSRFAKSFSPKILSAKGGGEYSYSQQKICQK